MNEEEKLQRMKQQRRHKNKCSNESKGSNRKDSKTEAEKIKR